MECYGFLGYGVDEEWIVWRKGIVRRETEFVDIEVGGRGWERTIRGFEYSIRVWLIFILVWIWRIRANKARPVLFENIGRHSDEYEDADDEGIN
jgi:hypothetical protein